MSREMAVLLMTEIKQVGGSLSVKDDKLHYNMPASARGLVEGLKLYRDDIVAVLEESNANLWAISTPEEVL